MTIQLSNKCQENMNIVMAYTNALRVAIKCRKKRWLLSCMGTYTWILLEECLFSWLSEAVHYLVNVSSTHRECEIYMWHKDGKQLVVHGRDNAEGRVHVHGGR